MRFGVVAAYAAMCASGAVAAPAETGHYSDQLRKILTQTASGTCPADLMGEKLLTACREQLPRLGPELKAAGPIQSLTFIKAEQINGERFETYKVTTARGETGTWLIGGLHDGKFNATYSNGE